MPLTERSFNEAEFFAGRDPFPNRFPQGGGGKRFPTVHAAEFELMPPRKRLEGALADWHPHPKGVVPPSLAPVVRDAAPVDEVADRFFAAPPEVRTPEPLPIVEAGKGDASTEPPAVRERRRYLMRYVATAVTVAALIVVAAVVRVTTARGAFAANRPVQASVNAASDPVLPIPSPAAEDPAAVAPEAPSAGTPPAAESADETPAENPEPDDRTAPEAKKESLHELELARLAASIDAGERAVALDPTDADAWLILGAAYQKRGAYADARRCFTSCAHQANHGNRFECWALLR